MFPGSLNSVYPSGTLDTGPSCRYGVSSFRPAGQGHTTY